MSQSVPERDWKYLRKIQPEMLESLCRRINQQVGKLLKKSMPSEHERYLQLYRHIEKSDQIVTNCFNDWRRSNIWLKITALRQEGLLTDEHLSHISDEVKNLGDRFAQLFGTKS